ncbi:winged helix-turn-helix domain-containing protein [Thalassobacillus sp. CUG 92003]|uniref:winged helix-turn-helix domain-containing protein n=1 Tax=Thalassobacillus sp. CUG 92003 TaxID=2736641 RepID=UPI0015E62D9D|nr:winged helix-turn-helix domain-containing protein [Thalassobacillus sp. CUG 92003]
MSNQIKFFHDEYKIKYLSDEISLLPKEFETLYFLYQNPSQIFTRAQLLEKVWPMESPTDRTVDDHIYRIRKHIEPLSFAIKIDTVRGQGYVLRLNIEEDHNPLIEDAEVSSHVTNLFRKYHLYGQGDALKLLEENQHVFGFELDLQRRLYLRFMNGDFHWLLESQDVPFWEKCYYLLHIYSYIEPDKNKSLAYFTKALNAKGLPDDHRLEIKLLNRLSLLIFTKHLNEAERVLVDSKNVIQHKKLEGFIPPIHLTELYLSFLRKDRAAIKENMNVMENLLTTYPFSREKAAFSIIKGIDALISQEPTKSKGYFDEGLEQFQKAKYVPGIFAGLHTIVFFLEEFNNDQKLSAYFKGVWSHYAAEYQLDHLYQRLSRLLFHHLK